jgi:Fic family protein
MKVSRFPEFIGARPRHLESLVQGMIDANDWMREGRLDSVLQAAATAFGFVYIHPLQDGNGRLHRCLIHNVLAEEIGHIFQAGRGQALGNITR